MSKTLNKKQFRKLTLHNRAEIEKKSRLKLCDEAWKDLEKSINDYGTGKTNYPFEPLSLKEKNYIVEIRDACRTIFIQINKLADNYPSLFKSIFRKYNYLATSNNQVNNESSLDVKRISGNCWNVLQLHGNKKRGQGIGISEKSKIFLREIIIIYNNSLDMDPRPPGFIGGPSFDKYYEYIRSLFPSHIRVSIPNTGRAAKKRAGFK